jgi:hypothetical protein
MVAANASGLLAYRFCRCWLFWASLRARLLSLGSSCCGVESADQARQDILKVTFGTETVPDLEGCTREKALGQLGQTSLQLVVDPASSTAADATVVSQIPLKDSQVLKGSQVVVKLDSAAPAAAGD